MKRLLADLRPAASAAFAAPASCLPSPHKRQLALQELERLRGELLALRERAGELAAIRDQLTQVETGSCGAGAWAGWTCPGIQ